MATPVMDEDPLPFPPENWKELPLRLRQRWWLETDYGRNKPSPELAATMREAVAHLLGKPSGT